MRRAQRLTNRLVPLGLLLAVAAAPALGGGPHAGSTADSRRELHSRFDAPDFGFVPDGDEGGGRAEAAAMPHVAFVSPGAAAPAREPARPLQMAIPYNGRFTFTRIRYGSMRGFRGRGNDAWAHDYPNGDLNLQTILSELTSVRPTLERSNVFDLEDPEIFKYPVLYMSEPGFWSVTDEGARNLRQHLLKGGMIIFDDFETPYWNNFYTQIKRVMPDYELIEVDGSHPVFNSFFRIEDVYVPHPFDLTRPTYTIMFEDNDPTKRPMVISNLNADLAEYWEYSGRGWFPVDPTNDAYKIGVNYIIYALTH